MKPGEEFSEKRPESVGEEGHEERADQVKAVQEDQFGKFREVGNETVIGGEVAAAGHPADVGPPEPLLTGRMDIDLLVRVSMVMPVGSGPPEGPSLDAE